MSEHLLRHCGRKDDKDKDKGKGKHKHRKGVRTGTKTRTKRGAKIRGIRKDNESLDIVVKDLVKNKNVKHSMYEMFNNKEKHI